MQKHLKNLISLGAFLWSFMDRQERYRLRKMSQIEKELFEQEYMFIAGVDEAGRGPLAGPVVAAACILPKGFLLEGINDSKLLSSEFREELFLKLQDNPDVHFCIAGVDSKKIDEINILQATMLAMKKSVEGLAKQPDFVLVDGNRKFDHSIPMQTYVKGDSRSISIAAASVFAKCHRDKLMRSYHEKWPEYGFDRHKGYGTAFHREALKKYGPCPIHRFSFAPVSSSLLETV